MTEAPAPATTPVLVPLTYWSNGNGVIHQVRRIMFVHTPGSAEPSGGTRTLCGQEVRHLLRADFGEGVPCKVCEAGGSNEIALVHRGLGTRWLLPEVDDGPMAAWMELGPVTISLYASENRPGGWTVDIEAPSGTDLLVAVNDGDVYNDIIPE